MDRYAIVNRNTLILSWNKARGFVLIEKQSDADAHEVELIEIELKELEEPDEQPIKESEKENELNPTEKKNQ